MHVTGITPILTPDGAGMVAGAADRDDQPSE
jgi:hypothetical protein